MWRSRYFAERGVRGAEMGTRDEYGVRRWRGGTSNGVRRRANSDGRHQSARSAMLGSTPVARAAGTTLATMATAIMMTHAAA